MFFAVVLMVGLMTAGHSAFAQSLTGVLGGTKPAPAAAPAAPTDPLNRTSPRSSILGLLEACHAGNFVKASRYLDLRKMPREERAQQGPELAEQLGQVLDRDSSFEVGALSNAPDGNRDDNLPADLEVLDTLQLNDQTIVLRMQHVTLNDGVKAWLVASDSLADIPELAALMEESPVEKHLPAPLVTFRLLGTSLWVWISLVLLAIVLSFLSKLFTRLVLLLLRPVQRRYATAIHVHRMNEFTKPLRLLLSVIAFRACMEVVPPSALVRLYITRLLALLFIWAAASLAMRFVDVISDRIASRFDARQRAISYSILSLAGRFVKICLFALAVLLVLENWGYNTNAVLAGLGVGGVAIALASQKSIENLFGGISVILDKPVLVGDFCNFGGQVGTVEDIGLRSTKIRTLDRTVVTIPNSTFSTMTLENFSKRDRVWFHPTLHLRRGTDAGQIEQAMDVITKILKDHPLLDASGVPLRFTQIMPESFDLDIFAYVLTADYNVFLQTQTELLLKILSELSKLGISFAVPVQESIVNSSVNSDVHKIFPALGAANGKDGRE
ncbi:MAG TPA: mechanosensitive ion channel family protein [Bryobacteraceae bacterium]|nr:mechanosensitive ion channel family protein [Bryobacteraceae bacterium]